MMYCEFSDKLIRIFDSHIFFIFCYSYVFEFIYEHVFFVKHIFYMDNAKFQLLLVAV